MFDLVGRASGPAQSFRCKSCETTFEMNRQSGENVVKVMIRTATGVTPWKVPKCPKCGIHRASDV